MLKNKLSYCVVFMMSFIFAMVGCGSKSGISSSDNDKAKKKSTILMSISKLHNGDAKFYENHIITSTNGQLTLCNLQGEIETVYEDLKANWVDSVSKEGIIIYANFDQQVGIAKLDKNQNLLSNDVIIKSKHLLIDPTMTKVDDTYYITVTDIKGNVNNSDKNEKNGTYTIKLYQSTDLLNWIFVSDVVSTHNNLEDVDVFCLNNNFYVCYEKEELDKGKSSICVTKSIDKNYKKWEHPKELLKPDCDHEPATIRKLKNGDYKLYYSCDRENLGKSYMGSKIYYALYDKNFNLLKQDVEIPTTTSKGILLYDVSTIHGKEVYLYAKNYLTDCDMVVEER